MSSKTYFIFCFLLLACCAKLYAPTTGSQSDEKKTAVKINKWELFKQNLENGKYGAIKDLFIECRGKLLFEKNTSPEKLHPIESVTKSILSIVIGIAVKRGSIRSMDQKIMEYFPAYKDRAQPGWDAVTIRDLLTMKSGIDWQEDLRPEYINPVAKMYAAKDIYKYIFSFKITDRQKFNYSSANAALLSEIMLKATGLSFSEYANKFLFGPLNITDYKCSCYRNKLDNTSGGLYLKAKDLLKIGELCVEEGQWQARQIVSKKWMQDSFYPRNKFNEYLDVDAYGYLWWINTGFKVGKENKKVKLYMANGYNNNHLIVAPAQRLVVVITGSTTVHAEKFLHLVRDVLLNLESK